MTWRWSYFIKVMLYWFLPKLFPFVIFFLYEILALQHDLQFSMNLDETFQLLFPWPEEAHIIQKCNWLLFLQDLWPFGSYCHVASRNYYLCRLFPWPKGDSFSMNLDESFQWLFLWPEEAHIIPRCTWLPFFSSPELKTQGELLWSLTIRRHRRCRRRRRPYVRPSTIFKQHLLLNHWLDFDQTSQEWSMVGPLSKLFKWFRSIAYLGHRS